jgi:SAM-dependent methyltransferase
LVEQEPVTRHAARRPRGYAGDAQLLDYIYGASPLPSGTSDLGRRLYEWGFQVPAQRSVRNRCELLHGFLDDLSARTGGRADVLSVACGHLRELPRDGVRRFRRFVGLDQDPRSLALVRRELGPVGVDVIEASIRRLAFARLDLGRFDFIYSAGLYDYLADPIAARLSEATFAMLNPGGRLLIANFAPWLRDIGYMEAIMDRQLIYRGKPHMLLLSAGLAPSEVRQQRLFFDRPRNVCFLEVEKPGAGADGADWRTRHRAAVYSMTSPSSPTHSAATGRIARREARLPVTRSPPPYPRGPSRCAQQLSKIATRQRVIALRRVGLAVTPPGSFRSRSSTSGRRPGVCAASRWPPGTAARPRPTRPSGGAGRRAGGG